MRIFYLSHLFRYRQVFWIPTPSPQLSGGIPFGKYHFDFPKPRLFVRAWRRQFVPTTLSFSTSVPISGTYSLYYVPLSNLSWPHRLCFAYPPRPTFQPLHFRVFSPFSHEAPRGSHYYFQPLLVLLLPPPSTLSRPVLCCDPPAFVFAYQPGELCNFVLLHSGS